MIKSISQFFKKSFPTGGVKRNVLTMALGTLSGQALLLASYPIITRLYSPESFGGYAVLLSILNIGLTISTLRLMVTITLPKQEETAYNLVALSFAVAFIIFLAAELMVFLYAPHILRILNLSTSNLCIWLLPLGLLLGGTIDVLSYWSLRQQNFKVLAISRVFQKGGLASSQVGLGLIQGGTIELLIGHFLGDVCFIQHLFRRFFRGQWDKFRSLTVKGMYAALVTYRQYPTFFSLAALIRTLSAQLPILFTATFFGQAQAGLFALTVRALVAPISFLGKSTGEVYYSESSRLFREHPPQLGRLYLKTAKGLFLIGVMPIAVVVGFGPFLFKIIFGMQWVEAGHYARILGIPTLIGFVVGTLHSTLNVIHRGDLVLIWDVVTLIGTALAFGIPYSLGSGIINCLISYSATSSLLYIGLFLLCWQAIGWNKDSVRRVRDSNH